MPTKTILTKKSKFTSSGSTPTTFEVRVNNRAKELGIPMTKKGKKKTTDQLMKEILNKINNK